MKFSPVCSDKDVLKVFVSKISIIAKFTESL